MNRSWWSEETNDQFWNELTLTHERIKNNSTTITILSRERGLLIACKAKNVRGSARLTELFTQYSLLFPTREAARNRNSASYLTTEPENRRTGGEITFKLRLKWTMKNPPYGRTTPCLWNSSNFHTSARQFPRLLKNISYWKLFHTIVAYQRHINVIFVYDTNCNIRSYIN